MDLFLALVLAVAGLVFGSFLNVCISRIPNDQSIVSPGSHCPHCGSAIRWYHNVPVISYLALRGRCAYCGRHISLRYPAVELLTAVLFVACFWKFGLTLALVRFVVFSFLLIGLIFMDAETGLLPAEFTYPGIAAGLGFAWFSPGDSGATEFLMHLFGIHLNLSVRGLSLVDALLAAVVGAGFFYVVWAAYYLVRKRHGLGFGDVALIAMCGAFLGLKLTLFVLFTAPIVGSLFAVVLLLRSTAKSDSQENGFAETLRTREIPFGVFLGASSLAAIFWGEATWEAYLAWVLRG